MHDFYPHAPKIKYVQDEDYACVLISLDSTLFAENENVAEHAVVSQISLHLSCDYFDFMNRIKFVSNILTYCVRNNV